jgi:hypothetical protein
MTRVRSKVCLTAAAFILFLLAPAHARAAPLLVENFNNVPGLAASGWSLINNSSPAGATGWFQGNDAVFPGLDGTTDYIAANFNNAGLGGDISNWLLTPLLTLNNGDTLSFFSQGAGIFADRLEVRLSTNGGSADVGGTASSVGDFGTLLLTINPALDPNGYPTSWTEFTLTLSGLSGPTDGRLAFRYFVTDTNTNANYIGIDDVTVAPAPVPEPATLTLLGLGLASLGARRYRQGKANA